MSTFNLTAVFEEACLALGIEPEMEFIEGSEALQNLLADKLKIFPCTFLDSPRTGKLEVKETGAIYDTLEVTFAVLDKATSLDDSTENSRTAIDAMKVYALKIFKHVVNYQKFGKIDSGTYTELEGVFDAHLTGVMVEFTIVIPLTDYGC